MNRDPIIEVQEIPDALRNDINRYTRDPAHVQLDRTLRWTLTVDSSAGQTASEIRDQIGSLWETTDEPFRVAASKQRTCLGCGKTFRPGGSTMNHVSACRLKRDFELGFVRRGLEYVLEQKARGVTPDEMRATAWAVYEAALTVHRRGLAKTYKPLTKRSRELRAEWATDTTLARCGRCHAMIPRSSRTRHERKCRRENG